MQEMNGMWEEIEKEENNAGFYGFCEWACLLRTANKDDLRDFPKMGFVSHSQTQQEKEGVLETRKLDFFLVLMSDCVRSVVN